MKSAYAAPHGSLLEWRWCPNEVAGARCETLIWLLMKKTCPACGRPVTDEAKEFCPACEKLDLSASKFTKEDFELVSQMVSERLKADWKFKAQIVFFAFGSVFTLVLLVISLIDAVVGFNLKESMQRHFQHQEQEAKQRIDERLESLVEDVKKTLAQLEVQMRSNITRNFEAPAIQAIIEDVAKVESKGILDAEVRPAVDSFREDAVFVRTIARAQAFDFKAYQRLLEIGAQTNDNASLANQVVSEIDRLLQRGRSEILGKTRYAIFSGTNFYGGPFTSDELALGFQSVQQDKSILNREGFVNTVKDLKEPMFLHRLIEFFVNETDLEVADRLAMAISGITKQDFGPRDFARIQTWWNLHKNEYTNWPFSEFDLGFDGFGMGRFAGAAGALRKVLTFDPSADMSRALAITSYFEQGETNQALELAKGFKNPTGRWAELAGAITELHTGNVSNATVRLVDFTRKNPTMKLLPKEGLTLWKKIDWQLFHKLAPSEKPLD